MLPPRVAWFNVRARATARRIHDDAPKASLRPEDLSILLGLANGRRTVVELGTRKAWTAIALALADKGRRVVTYDPIVQQPRDHYLALVGSDVRERITLVDLQGETGPIDGLCDVDFLLIDSSHARQATIREYVAWKPALAPGAIVVFDDYSHPDFPGVKEAVDADLKLDGHTAGLMFIHRAE
jgi:predicted O-methyltransferase YrrM